MVRRLARAGIDDSAEAFPGPPDLAIEVLSPSNMPAARTPIINGIMARQPRNIVASTRTPNGKYIRLA